MRKSRVFIFIAAVLITLLMSVACDNTPVLDNSNDLVLASISVTGSRSLVSSGAKDELSEIVQYACVLKHLWTIDSEDYSASEEVYGDEEKYYENIGSDGVIGWVTPGFWSVTVYGYNSAHMPIFVGTTEVYFSPTNSKATVFMTPINGTGSVSFSITQPMLSDNIYEYNYIYRLYDITGNTMVISDEDGNSKKAEGVIKLDSNDGITGTYSASLSNIPYGMYSLAVYCYRNNTTIQLDSVSTIENGSLIGGEYKKLFLYQSFMSETITGTLDFSDFVESDINISLLTINGSLSVTSGALSKETDITFSLTDETTSDADKENYNITYDWYVNGIRTSDTSTAISTTQNFGTYGPKEIACVVTYQHKVNTERVYTATIKNIFTILP
ncbi:MAG: hypothetical protein MSS69_08725 [Spirochaetales bacterium]|nr:hypothetical protein [Spirochaetales bacterium]